MQKKLRLRSAKDFAKLRQSGKTRRHPLCTMSYIPNNCGHNRYGVITSKQLGNAVIRNRTRRQLREALRFCHPYLEQGYDVVIVARPKLAGQTYQTMLKILQQMFQQAHLFQHPPLNQTPNGVESNDL